MLVKQTALVRIPVVEAISGSIIHPRFEDNGALPDGNALFIPSDEVDETECEDNALVPFPARDGWELQGYSQVFASAFTEASVLWMGNDSQEVAYFLATEEQVDELIASISQIASRLEE